MQRQIRALRKAARGRKRTSPARQALAPIPAMQLNLAMHPRVPTPAARTLRIFAYDPSLQTDPEMFGVNEALVTLPWEEELGPGPVGEYVEVVDVDPASQCCYAPVDLNDKHLLAQSGLAPSESNPQFHQQMVYAVAMRTIERFERALGRKALWAKRIVRDPSGIVKAAYVPRLRIYPHALREENAYYSRDRMALLFGYFRASEKNTATTLPSSRVFCAVSHDIVAHETAHALLDGLHPRYQEATNPDVHAFHEAFADIVAMFQHFTMPESLLHQIRRARGNLEEETLLGQLAVQFGEASGRQGALRSAIGRKDKSGAWQKEPVSREAYRKQREDGEPHALGALLVSAVFAAFVTIYRSRSADLVRLATGGTGVLPDGAIPHDLALRLSKEAAKVADQVLNMCIRALDYCPPVDLTFGDYLRALITADRDLVRNDARGYRVALISAFRDRGIFPVNVAHLAEDSLVWEEPPSSVEGIEALVMQLNLRWSLNTDRQSAFEKSRDNGKKVHQWLTQPAQRELLRDIMGFDAPGEKIELAGMTGEMRPIEVHSVRPSRRTGPDGNILNMLVVEVTQTFRAQPDGDRYRGGCTLLVDLNANKVRYFIRKRLRGSTGAEEQRKVRQSAMIRSAEDGLRYAAPATAGEAHEAFRLLHRRVDR